MSLTMFVAIAAGATLGAWLRFIFTHFFNAVLPNLPLGTLAANLVGGFLVGVAVEFFFLRHSTLPPEWRLFVITGFLGGLTTFSTFSAEAVELMQRGAYGWALAHTGAHLFGSLTLTALGMFCARALKL
jgi:CrcB protein